MTDPQWHGVVVTLATEVGPDDDRLDALSGALFELGAGGLETKDERRPITMIAAFPPEVAPEGLIAAVEELLGDLGVPSTAVALQTYEPVDWAEHWRQHFHPIGFGPLWIVPSWLEPPKEAQKVLRIDPSMAFGTGLHATTALCLERIVELASPGPVLDVGTGTGILALGALLLGAESAVATDNDPDALRVARENAEVNGLLPKLRLSSSDVAFMKDRFPLVVANILAGPLEEMAPALSKRVAPGGHLVLSGILATQAEDVARAYEAAGLNGRHIVQKEEWVRIDFTAPAR